MLKVCTQCGIGSSKFYPKSGKCASCCCAAKRLFYVNNREVIKDRVRQYRLNNKDKVNSGARRWGANNPQRVAEYSRRKRLKNKLTYDAINSRYNMRKKANGGSHTEGDWLRLLAVCNNRCLMCGSQYRIEKDHIIPVSMGGKDDIQNIQPLCRSCNARKCNRESVDYVKVKLFEDDIYLHDNYFNSNDDLKYQNSKQQHARQY